MDFFFRDTAKIIKEFDRKGSFSSINKLEDVMLPLRGSIQNDRRLMEFRALLLGFQNYLYSWIKFMRNDEASFGNLLQDAGRSFSEINLKNWERICKNEKLVVVGKLSLEQLKEEENFRTFMLDPLIISNLKILFNSSNDLARFRDWNLARSILEIAHSRVLKTYDNPNPSMRELINKTILFSTLSRFSEEIRSIPEPKGVSVLVLLQNETFVTEGQESTKIPIMIVNLRNEVIYDVEILGTRYINRKAIVDRLLPNENTRSHLELLLPKKFSSLSLDISMRYSTTFDGQQITSSSCVIYSKKKR